MGVYSAIGLFALGFFAGGWSVHWMGTRDWLFYLQPRPTGDRTNDA